MRFLSYFSAACLFLSPALTHAQATDDTWLWRGPQGTARNLTDIAFSDGRFVAVGEKGTILLSENGEEWWRAKSGSYRDFVELVAGNGQFIAYSGSGGATPFSSPNGEIWTQQATVPVAREIKFHGDQFTGLPYSGNKVYTSANGLTWVEHTIAGLSRTSSLNIFDRGPGFYYTGAGNLILTSQDLVTWRASDYSDGNPVATATFNGRQYVASQYGAIHSSANGMTWRLETTLDSRWNSMASGNGALVVVGGLTGLRVGTTTDGTEWQMQRLSSGSGYLQSVTFGDGRFVAIGDGGELYSSADGLHWRRGRDSSIPTFNSVVAGDDGFVAVGNGGAIRYSATGAVWTDQTSPTDAGLMKVIHGGGRYLATGIGGNVVLSPNGRDWTAHSIGENVSLGDAAYGNGIYMVSASYPGAAVWISIDGQNWEKRTHENLEAVESLTFGNGVFVAGGRFGRYSVSSDGVSWQLHNIGDNTTLRTSHYVNGSFFLQGNQVHRSEDGVTWQQLSRTGTLPSDIVFHDGAYWATPRDSGSSPQIDQDLFTSTDGANWLPAGTGWPIRLRAVAARDGVLVAVGEDGAIVQSGDAGDPPVVDWISPDAGERVAAHQVVLIESFVQEGAVQVDRVELLANGEKVAQSNEAPFAIQWTPPALGRYNLVLRAVDTNGVAEYSSGREVIAELSSLVQVHPVPPREIIQDFAFGNGRFVAVGNEATLLVSEDGREWQRVVTNTTADIHSVVFANGQFLAVDGGQYVLQSEDGLDWSIIAEGQAPRLQLVRYLNGQFVASSVSDRLYTSEDGHHWKAFTPSESFVFGLSSLIWAEGRYYATSASHWIVYSSEDLQEWRREVIVADSPIRRVTYGDGIWVATGDQGTIITSNNGTNWERVPTDIDVSIRAAIHNGSQFVIADDDGRIFVSDDGRQWVEQPRVAHDVPWTLAYAGGQHLFSFGNGNIVSGGDLANLHPSNPGPGDHLNAVAYGPDGFVAVGANGVLLHSINGFDWIPAARPNNTEWFSVAYGDGRYVAVGRNGAVASAEHPLFWQTHASPATNHLHTVIRGDGQFIAGGERGDLLRSSDGESWESVASGTALKLSSGAYGAGGFLLLAGNQEFLRSTDGETWQNLSTAPIGFVTQVVFDGARFFALGSSAVWESEDGIQWTRLADKAGGFPSSAAAEEGLLITTSSGDDSRIAFRTPDDSWFEMAQRTASTLRGVELGNGWGIAVGEKGTIWAVGNPKNPFPSASLELLTDGGPLRPGDPVTLAVSLEGEALTGPSYDFYVNGRLVGNFQGLPSLIPWSAPSFGRFEILIEVKDGDRRVAVVAEEIEVSLPTFISRHPVPSTGVLHAALFDGEQFVVAGSNATVATSADGLLWQGVTTNLGSNRNLNRLTHGLGVYVAALQSGPLYYSTDLSQWHRATLGETTFSDVIFTGEGFFAVGEDGQIATSAEGIVWNVRQAGIADLRAIAFGSGTFVASGAAGLIVYSADGENWSEAEGEREAPLSKLAFGNDRFLAIGDGVAYGSGEGAEWDPVPAPVDLVGSMLQFVDGYFYASSSSGALLRTTGEGDWQVLPTEVPSPPRSLAAGEEHWIAVGDPGLLLLSGDGSDWRRHPGAWTAPVHTVAHGNGRHVAALDGTAGIAFSDDGIAWQYHSAPAWMRDVTFALDHFVGVGRGMALLSPDGMEWEVRPLPANEQMNAIAFHDGRFVAVGAGGGAVRSDNGLDWTAQTTGISETLYDIAAGGPAGLIAVGASGRIVQSSDGSSWTVAGSNTSASLHGVAFGNGLYVAGGGNGAILFSEDGQNWQSVSLGSSPVHGVDFVHGTFFASAGEGTLHWSTDGTAWQTVSLPTSFSLFGVREDGDGGILVWGDRGVIFGSPELRPELPAVFLSASSSDVVSGETVTFGALIPGEWPVERVEIFKNHQAWETVEDEPWQAEWTAKRFGLHVFRAEAILTNGTRVASGSVEISVRPMAGRRVLPRESTGRIVGIVEAEGDLIGFTSSGEVLQREFSGAWKNIARIPVEEIRTVVSANGTIFAAGKTEFALSGDGMSWEVRPLPLGSDESQFVFAAGGRLFAGQGTSLASSTDGKGWVTTHFPGRLGSHSRIAYGNGAFILIDDDGHVYRSVNGETWTSAANLGVPPNDLLFAEGLFIIVAEQAIFFSESGEFWADAPTPAPFQYLAFGASGLIAVDMEADIWNSIDGIAWVQLTDSVLPAVSVLFATEDRVFLGGDYGTILTSTSAQEWVRETPTKLTHFRSIDASPDLAVAVGSEGGTMVSRDGLRWEEIDVGIDGEIEQVRWLNDRFVAVGHEGQTAWSSDGIHWVQVQAPTTRTLRAVAGGIDSRVAVGDGGVILYATGDDGVWTEAEAPTGGDLSDVAYGEDGFLAVGRGGRILRSKDGWKWEIGSTETTRDLSAVAAGPWGWITVEEDSLAYLSSGNAPWVPVVARSRQSADGIKAIRFIRGSFWAAAGSEILLSADGHHWTTVSSGTAGAFRDLVHFKNNILAVGDGTELWRFALPQTAPEILKQPTTIHVVEGDSFRIKMWVDGANPLSAEWSRESEVLTDGDRIRGSNSHTLDILEVTLADAGLYQVTFTNEAGMAVGEPVEVTVHPSVSFDEWLVHHFDEIQRADSTLSAPSAAPAGDGVPNLLKYVLGLDPWAVPSPSRLPTAAVLEEDGRRYLSLEVRRFIHASGATLLAQAAGDLRNWPAGISNTVQVGSVAPHGDGTETVVYRDTVPMEENQTRFMRIAVSLLEP